MATTITLEGAARTEFGKGAARRMRVANLIPATVYAGGEDPTFVQLPMKETTLALRHTNALFTIKFGDETKMAVVKDVQRNPVKRIVEHVDFYEVKAGEKIDVEVPVFVEGRLSNFFYRVDRIRRMLGVKFNIEMLWLSDEMFSQKGKHFRILVGDPIPVAELQRYGALRDQADYVRKKAYFLENMLLPAENNG
mgnify:CR=1 FL=1